MAIDYFKDFNAGADIQNLRNLYNRLKNQSETTWEEWANLSNQALRYVMYAEYRRKAYPLIQKQLDKWIAEARSISETASGKVEK